MGWQKQNWRTPRGGIRSRRNELTLLAMLVSVAVSLAGWQLHLFPFHVSAPRATEAPTARVVYGTGLAHSGASQMTCTAMAADGHGGESCTVWTILLPSQHAVQAIRLPVGTTCPAVIADQDSGRWVCSKAVTT